MGNVTLLELVWTLSSVIGLGSCVAGVKQALEDKHSLKISGVNGVNELLINSDLRREALKIPLCLLFLVIGILSMATPSREQTLSTTLVAILVIATQMLFVLSSVLDRLLRRQLDSALAETR